MKILQLTDFFDPFLGGMEQHVKTLSRKLVERGHDVTVVTTRLPDTADVEEIDGVQVKRITGWSDRILARWYEHAENPFRPPVPDPGMVVELKKITAELRPDVVNAQGWSSYSYAAIGRSLRPPLVVTMHDHGFICPRKTLFRYGKAPCSGPRLDLCVKCSPGQYGIAKGIALTTGLRAVRQLHSRVDSWVAVSEFVKHSNRSALPRDGKVSVIPSASPHAPSAPRRLDWLPTEDYLLFVGALGKHKGLDWILETYANADFKLPLVVIGTSRGDTPQTWPTGAIVKANIPHSEVMTAWKSAKIGLAPSLWPEPFGLTAVEAMRSGVPLVASRVGALPEIVDDGVTGLLVAPGNSVELQAAIQRLDNDEGLRQAMSSASLIRSRQFDADSVADLYEHHYVDLISSLSSVKASSSSCSKEM